MEKHKIVKSKYGMLSIFMSAFGQTETILTFRRLSKRFYELSKDPYIIQNFKQDKDRGVFVDIRHIEDLKLLTSAVRYAAIIMAIDFLNVNVSFEHPRDKSVVRQQLDQIITELGKSQSFGHLSFETANGYYFD